MTTSPALHVVPGRLGGWHVQREGEDRPLSDHGSATEAERSAVRQARQSHANDVMVHDRYGRIRRASRRSP